MHSMQNYKKNQVNKPAAIFLLVRRVTAASLCVVLFLCCFLMNVSAVGQAYNGVTTALTPHIGGKLLFAKKFGADYKAAPTPPVVAQNTLLVVSGIKLYKLDAQTGEEIASVKMQGSTMYATVGPLYADGKVFVQLDGGMVQAFDFASLQSLWVYEDSLGGQAICPITYENGYIYTGFWNGEAEKANYVCLLTKDEDTGSATEAKQAVWQYGANGGFYWAGCYVTEQFVIVGCDDGADGSAGASQVVVLNKNTGECVSSAVTIGDIRSSVAYSQETGAVYVSSKAGYIYKFNLNHKTGELTLSQAYTADGAVTATPVLYGTRLYAGCQSGLGGEFIVLDAQSMAEIYTDTLPGYPQASALVSSGYKKTNGKIYIYLTCNKKPGGITVFEDCEGQSAPKKTELFMPDSTLSEYCISTIAAGEDGTLYFKNDSGNIFAVKRKNENVFLLLRYIFTFFTELIKELAPLSGQ